MAHTTPTARRDIYAEITDKIIAAIEQNPGEPVLPWHRSGFRPVIPKNAATGNDYRGVNILSLWVTALERGYESGVFATYKQWSALGAGVSGGPVYALLAYDDGSGPSRAYMRGQSLAVRSRFCIGSVNRVISFARA
mgnify:CR=1 FL=1